MQRGAFCCNINGSLVVDDVFVGVAALGGAAVVAPVAAIVGDHHLGAVLIVSQVAQLTVLHNNSRGSGPSG